MFCQDFKCIINANDTNERRKRVKMKTKKNKKGISLIVLVITIIVMIILAAAIIISISNSGIVNRANEAVEKTTEAQLKQLATVAWSEAHLKETIETKDDAYYLKEVKAYILAGGITEQELNKYIITATTQGVSVSKKDMTVPVASVTTGEVTAFTMVVNVTATDSETGIKEYRYYIKKDAETEYILKATLTTATYKFEELDYNTKYDVKIEVEDNSENVTTVYSEDITTETVEITTLGALVATAEDYGDSVNYTANDISDWKVFYKQTVSGEEEFVYLIASDVIPASKIPTSISNAIIGTTGIFWENNVPAASFAGGTINKARWLVNWTDKYSLQSSSKCISYFVDENYWLSFKNTSDYGDNVVGAIGTPTVEMFVASWNAKRSLAVAGGDTSTYNVELTLSDGTDVYAGYGYCINNTITASLSQGDLLYSGINATPYWMASPNGGLYGKGIFAYRSANICANQYINDNGLRPVICFKSSTPAYAVNENRIMLVTE